MRKRHRNYGWLSNFLSPYGIGGAGATLDLPQLGSIIFQHDLYDGDTTAQVGSYTYTRSGTVAAASAQTTLTSYGANVLPLGRCFGAAEDFNGAWFGGSVKNWLLYSEDLSDASWVKTSCTITANDAVAPDGTTTADKINGAVGSYVTQDSGQAPSTYAFPGSVWLKTVSGTATVAIQVFDGSGQLAFVDCPLTTTWRRFQVCKKFETGSSGTVSFRIKTDVDIHAWGMQLERYTSTNTAGSRYRTTIANPYVKTTSVVAETGNSAYNIPNAIVSTISTVGSFAAWVYCETDIFDGGFNYLASINDDRFLITFNNNSVVFYINGAVAARTPTTDSQDFNYFLEPYAWTHICVTWNTTTDVYKIYLNGVDRTGTTTACAAISVSTNTMTIGMFSTFPYVGADAYISEIVLWNVQLSASEAAQAYQVKQPFARRASLGTGLLFEADLGQSLIPTTGDDEYNYAKRMYGSWFYPDTTTTLAQTSMDALPIGPILNSATAAEGLHFNSNNQNLCLQSEAIGTTWLTTGAPTITEAGGTFLGTLNYGTILGVANDGIYQDIASAFGTDKFVGSVYASVSAGTLACRLTLIRDPAGVAETINQDITLTTTPQRFNVYADFSANATNVRFQFTLQAAGTARVGGFMFEPCSTLPRGNYTKIGSPYIRTTTTSQTVGWNFPVYRAKDSFNSDNGTAIFWAYLYYDPNVSSLTTNGPTFLASPGQGNNLYMTVPPDSFALQAHGITNAVTETPFINAANTWTHFACTWNYDDTTNTIVAKVFVNGVEVQSTTTGSAKWMSPNRKFCLGADYAFGPMDYWQGAIGQVRIYGEAKDATFIDADYDNTKADYGF